MAMDIGGVGIFLTGAAAIITAVGSIVLQKIAINRAGNIAKDVTEVKATTAEVKTTTDATHKLVNGQSEKLNAAIGEAAFAAGEKRGVESEREHPMVPAP